MTQSERLLCLARLPKITDDTAWFTLTAPSRRDKIHTFIGRAAQLYSLSRDQTIGFVRRERVPRAFRDLWLRVAGAGEPIFRLPVTKENLYPLLALERLTGQPLLLPLEYFLPDEPGPYDTDPLSL